MRFIPFLLVASAAFCAEGVTTPIDNDQVKVLKVVQAGHEKTRLHQHKVNRVMIYLQAGRQEFEFPDAKKKILSWKAGDALWSPAGGMHTAQIISNDPVTIVEIELKKPGSASPTPPSPLDPVKVNPKLYKVEFENGQVRVVRVKIAPHQTSPVHEHVLNRVIAYITDQKLKVTTADGKSDIVEHKTGDVSWGGPTKHKEENISDKPFEVVVVELKS